MKHLYFQKFLSVLLFLLITDFSFSQSVGLNFDGTNDYIQTTYEGVTGSSDRTFEAWVYVSTTAPASNLAIIDYGLNAVGSRNTFNVTGSRGLSFISGGTNANIGTGTNVVPEGQWVHVAFVLNGGTGYLYVNGVQEGTGSLSSVNTPTGNSDVRIGQRVTGGSIPFNGNIDEVRIYDYARTVTEINADMNSEYCTIPAGLVAYYRLNDGVANGTNTGLNTAADDSGNGNTGTLNNFSLSGTVSNWAAGAVLTPGLNGSQITVNTCSAYTSSSGMVYSSTGTYYETLTNSAGCDSLLEIILSISPLSGSIDVIACDSYTSPSGNYVYTGSGLFYDTLQTSMGCDSVISISLTIDNYEGTTFVSACDSYTTPDGNDTWTASGLYPVTYTGAAGCDSVVNYDLTILDATSSTISPVSCGSYIPPSGGAPYTSSGVYSDVVSNSAGCDSTITINLTVVNVDNGVTQTGSMLTADQTGATYQWYTCSNGNIDTPVAGETSQSFSPMSTGDYAVEVTINNCSVLSACYTVDLSGVNTSSIISAKIYPNPSNGNFAIRFSEIENEMEISLIDIQGKTIVKKNLTLTKKVLVTEKLPSGIYFLKLEVDRRASTYKVVIL
ncbi:MAG: LamG-like jellyroll fold domain-containing protein [Crocinitomicaceae bacterium]